MSVPVVLAQQPIETVEQLRAHLHQAAQVEMSTIPLYLYAAYSIKTMGYSQWATGTSALRAIRSVAIEEMLHLCLVRNLMLSIDQGDEIRFYDERFLPTYPSEMLHREPKLMLHLRPCSVKLMKKVFLPLETPSRADAPPQPHKYSTLGSFYAAIVEGFERLSGPELWKRPHADLQYYTAYWDQDGGGYPVRVKDLPSALQAIRTIVEQGEGAAPGNLNAPTSFSEPKPGHEELSHYGKFLRIAEGIDEIGEVWPLPTDPRLDQYTEQARTLAVLFNASYCYLLKMLDKLYETSSDTARAGAHSKRYGLERTCIAAMGGLLFPLADLLVRLPSGMDGLNAAPTFEFHRFDADRPCKEQLIEICAELTPSHPSLGGDGGVQRMIGLLPAV